MSRAETRDAAMSEQYRDLGWLSSHETITVGLSCHHCRVSWAGCAAAADCPECGACKGYHEDDQDECYCRECKPEMWPDLDPVVP